MIASYKPEVQQFIKPKLKGDILFFNWDECWQKITEKLRGFYHRGIERTQQWPPFIQHLLSAPLREVARYK